MKQSDHYPGIRQAIWLLVLVSLLIVLLSIFVGILGEVIDVSLGEHPAVVAVVNLIAIGVILMQGLKKTNAPFKDVFPLKPIQMLLLLPMVFTIIGVDILLSEMDNLFRTLLPAPKWIADFLSNLARGQTSLWGSIAVLVVVAPLTEELLFRGLILRGFLSRYTVRKAILASAILFGLFHLNPWQLLGAIILGVLFAWWFMQTGSLLPCLFGHAFSNAMLLILTRVFHLYIPGLTGDLTKVEFQPIWLDFVGLLLAGSGIWILTRMFRKASTRRHAT